MATTTLTVLGMTCDHCVRAVTEELTALGGVQDVAIDLADGSVTLTSDRPIDPAAITTAIDEAGYEVAP
jgi:copper chaperone